MNKDDKHLDGSGLDRVWAKIKANFLALSGDQQLVDSPVVFKYNDAYAGIYVHRGHASSGAYIGFENNNTTFGYIGMTSSGLIYRNASLTSYKIWNESNDGAGSGLDADKLDGQEGSYYATAASVTTLQTSLETAVNTLSAGLGTLQASLGTMAYRESDEFLSVAAMGESKVTWSNGTSAGPTLNIQFADLLTQSAAIPSASASYAGIVTTGAQTFAGAKTFSGAMTASSTLSVVGGAYFSNKVVIDNNKAVTFLDATQAHSERTVMTLNSSNTFALGYGTAAAGYTTKVHGATIELRTGTNDTLAATVDGNKDLTVERNIVAVGGVACNGIADLTLY